MVGSGPGVMMYDRVLFTCKVLTETETWILNGCHILFGVYPDLIPSNLFDGDGTSQESRHFWTFLDV